MTVDYIIVGQGIAGTAFAQQLYQSKKSFIVFDRFKSDQSSRLASGIWNPVVLKRMKKVWQADDMLNPLMAFYSQAEKLFGSSFIDDTHVHRLLASDKERNDWTTLADQPSFQNLINPLPFSSQNDHVKDDYGLGEVLQSGRIHTGRWLDSARDWLNANKLLIEDGFDHQQLQLESRKIGYQEIDAKRIVFCEGMHTAMQNPFFGWLPFALTKGEVIHIKSTALKLDKIVNGSVFVLPLGHGEYKIGATYAWNTMDTTPTDSAKAKLLQKVSKIIDVPFEVIEQKAGIRPTVSDRRPLLGTHPTHSNLHILNGLGSRGVLMAPYLSKMLLDHLEKGTSIHPEADIKRFLRKHYSA